MRRYLPLLVFLISGIVFFLSQPVSFASDAELLVARTHDVGGAPVSGDLISFERASKTFVLSHVVGDPNLYGVVAANPAVTLRSTATGTPVVTAGEAMVNVTTINGPIVAGDYITSSTLVGKGEKSTRASDRVIGVALESFPPTGATVDSGQTTYSGMIRVLLSVGARPANTGGVMGAGGVSGGSATGINTPLANVLKYALATLVVMGSIFVAFRTFGASLRNSIVSVGRNPLAKPAIQSMVVINTVLVILVTAVGLFIGLMILFVQL